MHSYNVLLDKKGGKRYVFSNKYYFIGDHTAADFIIVQHRRMGIMVTHRDIYWRRILEEVRDT